MNAHFRPPVIECLQALWVSLPVKAPMDAKDNDAYERQAAILDAYCYALRSVSPEAIRNVVDALRDGRIKDASKRFCPTAPELATYARDEQARLDAINRPRTITYQAESRPFRDMRIVQRQAIADERRAIIEQVSVEEARVRVKQGRYPVGSRFYWAIETMAGPPGSAKHHEQP